MPSRRELIAATAALPLLPFRPAQAAEPLKIRLSFVAPMSSWGTLLPAKKELASHWGKSYVLEPVHFTGTPLMITALANGELEIADLAFSTLPIAIQNAGIDDLRVIADEFQDGVKGYYSAEFHVLADGPIKTVADLKGKVLATNAVGSAVDVAMRAMLRKSRLEDKRDYTVIEAPLPAMRAMLAEKKADLIASPRPFSMDPELRKIARVLFTQADALGVTQFTVLAARASFIEKNRAALVDLMEDMLRIGRWYRDPANNKEIAEIAGKMTKQPAERFTWLFTKDDSYHSPNLLPDLTALQANIDTVKDLGFIQASFDIRKYADLSLAEEAGRRAP